MECFPKSVEKKTKKTIDAFDNNIQFDLSVTNPEHCQTSFEQTKKVKRTGKEN